MTHTARSLLAIGFLAALVPAAEAKPTPKQVLFFTKSAGYEHSVIRVTDGQPGHAEKILKALGEKNGFEVTHTKDGNVFTREGLAKYDALVFFTTGDLTTEGLDKQPPMPPGGKELLLETVRKGRGFVGLHTSSDTFLTPGDHFADNGEGADPYIKMVGGEFIAHGPQQKGKVYCADPKFPGFADAKDGFELLDEWYSFKNLGKDLHVLLWLATWNMPNVGRDSVYRRGPYPIAWTRMHGKGRVFHHAMGHREDVWTNPMFQSMVVGGIKWASGAVSAVTKPNVAVVTPYYAEMPPKDPRPEPAKPATAAPAAAKPAAAVPAKP